jgi:hypothetical protein
MHIIGEQRAPVGRLNTNSISFDFCWLIGPLSADFYCRLTADQRPHQLTTKFAARLPIDRQETADFYCRLIADQRPRRLTAKFATRLPIERQETARVIDLK